MTADEAEKLSILYFYLKEILFSAISLGRKYIIHFSTFSGKHWLDYFVRFPPAMFEKK